MNRTVRIDPPIVRSQIGRAYPVLARLAASENNEGARFRTPTSHPLAFRPTLTTSGHQTRLASLGSPHTARRFFSSSMVGSTFTASRYRLVADHVRV